MCGLAVVAPFVASCACYASDILYVGEYASNSVKKFDATTGAYLGMAMSLGGTKTLGINGLIIDHNHDLLVVNQNTGTPYNGAVLRYNATTGADLGPLVPQTDPNGPWAPRGIVIGKDGKLYVADMGEVDAPPPGYIDRFNATTGAYIDQLTAPGLPVTFQPRGMVFGPDGLLYVTNYEDYASNGTGQAGLGSILRFDTSKPPASAYLGQFVNRDGSSGGPPLLSPEGLTFGPNGDLYALTNGHGTPSAPQDDYIIRYNGKTGAYVSSIDIGATTNARIAAALLFGPNDKLYVPMATSGSPITSSGEVREYDMNLTGYSVFIPSTANGGPLVNPWFLTFGQTDSGTLQYVPEPSTLALLGFGAIWIVGYVWRRRCRASA
jgi:hypothetical protein